MSTSFSSSRANKQAPAANTTTRYQQAVQPEPVTDDEVQDDFEEDDDDAGDDEFSRSQRMPPQNPATRTCFQLMELMNSDPPYLDLNPHYQRNVVWTRKAKQLLIDSMFEGFYIPPVIFNVTKVQDEHGRTKFKRTCVDGKQRLSSIRDFMRGVFPWRVRDKEWYFCTPTMEYAKNKPILPTEQQQIFGNKNLLCVEYMDLTQTQEIELFQRVQLGKPLTKAETFKASQGPWQDLARVFEVDYADVVNLPRQNNRASQFWFVLSCFSQIYECMDPSGADGIPKLRTRVPQIEKLCANEKSLDRTTKSHLRMVFDTFLQLVHEDQPLFDSSRFKTTKTFSPIEFQGICCLLSLWGEQRPIGMLRGDIRLLRDHLRQRHSELRSDDVHWATCWNYIEDLEGIRGAVDEGTMAKSKTIVPDHPRLQQTSQGSVVESRYVPPQKNPKTPKGTTAKRGRKPVGSDDDGDFRPSATAKRGTTGSGKRSKPNAPRASTHVASYAIDQDPTPLEPEQLGLSASASDESSPWDSEDERKKAARRAERAQRKQKTATIPSQNFSKALDQHVPNTSVPQAAKAPVAPMVDVQTARKRALMDLGGSGNTARDLEAKKARVMATRIKHEE